MPLTIGQNIEMRGRSRNVMRPLDYRYGPWESIDDAMFWLNNPPGLNVRMYYGMTIGIVVRDDENPRKIIGVDDYWWQPECIYDESTGTFKDGFIRKFPANTPKFIVKEEGTGKILGISSDENNYNVVWRDDAVGDQEWNYITGRGSVDSYEEINSEYFGGE